MSRLHSDCRHRDENGFSLIEIVVVMSLLSIVMAMIASALWTTQRSETYSRGRTQALDEMRIALNRMSKDLRQTNAVIGVPTSSHLEIETYVDGSLETVIYNASGDKLTRTILGGAAELVHQELVSTDVFTYKPDEFSPELVTVQLVVKPSNLPDTTLTLDAKVDLRNR